MDYIFVILYNYFLCNFKGELQYKMNLWSNNTLVPSLLFSEICFHDN